MTHDKDEREPEPQNTFTRWVNNHLKKVPEQIQNLESDLSDGLKLIKLVEVLAQRHVGRYSAQVKFRHQKLENVSVALNFLQKDEGIKIVNIDSSHIVDQNKKLILGLIWTLILHYSIAIHMEDDERPEHEPDKTPKQRLLAWVRKKLPEDVPVTNFTNDWNDGLALGSLVNSISPDSLSDWRHWEPDEALENTRRAMKAASEDLGVAPLITPEELINPNVDEKSVMTYLAQFPQQLKERKKASLEAEVKPPLRKGKLQQVEPTVIAGRPAEFRVYMPTEEHRPKVSIVDAEGGDVHFTLTRIPATTSYTGRYTPQRVGPAKISLATTFIPTGESIASDSAEVDVVEDPEQPPESPEDLIDISKLRIYGPGVEGPVYSQQPTHFTIDAKQAGPGAVEVALADRNGRAVDIDVLDNQDGSFTVKYTAPKPGAYQLNVVFAGVDGPPIEINVKPHVDKAGIRVEGLENALVTVNCEKEVHVFTSDGENTRILITAPSGRVVEALIESTPTGFRVLFTPSEIGDYSISVTYEDLPVGQQPLLLHSVPKAGPNASEAEYVVSRSGPPRADLVRISGPGLGPVMATRSTHVHIDASAAGFGNIDLFVDGPTRTPIHCVDNHDGTCSMYYVPRVPGMYWLRVMFEDQHVPGSPFQVVACAPMLSSPKIIPDRDKTASPFPSLSSEEVLSGHVSNIRVDVGRNVAHAQGLQLLAHRPNGKVAAVPVEQIDASNYKATFQANELGDTRLEVLFDEEPICSGTLKVKAGQDASKCRAHGPGLEKATVDQPASFQIDTQGAGDGGLALEISGPTEAETEVVDFKNGSCGVHYITREPGQYRIDIMYGDEKKHIPGSPFHVQSEYPHDISQVHVEGLDSGEHRVGDVAKVVVDASKTAPGKITASLPAGQSQPVVHPLEHREGAHVFEISPKGQPGEVVPLEIRYDGEPIPGSPFPLRLLAESEPEKARLAPLESRAEIPAGQRAHALLDTKDCGKVSDVTAAVTGPDGHLRHVDVVDKGNGLHELGFETDLAGTYPLECFINGHPVSEHPLNFYATPVGNLDDVRIIEKPTDAEWLIGEEKRIILERRVPRPEARVALLKSHPDSIHSRVVQKQVDGKIQEHILVRPTELGKQTVNVIYGGDLVKDGDVAFEVVSELTKPIPVPIEVKKEEDQIKLNKAKELESQKLHKEEPFYPSTAEKYQFLSEQRARGEQLLAPLEKAGRLEKSRDSLIEAKENLYYGLSKEVSSPSGDKEFLFNIGSHKDQKLEAEVLTPLGTKDKAELHDLGDGTVAVRYSPKSAGPHELVVKSDGVPLAGTPLKFNVASSGVGAPTAYGPGLISAVAGEPAVFEVDSKGTHDKELSVSVEGAMQAPISIQDHKNGVCSVTWTPPVAGEYKVYVRLGGKEVADSPYTVPVVAHRDEILHLGSASEFSLNVSTSEGPLKDLTATIKAPSGHVEPCIVRSIENGRLGVSFTPREVGDHLIHVYRDGQPIPKSPFKIKVDESQLGDVSKVRLEGDRIHEAKLDELNEILVNTKEAGYGSLAVSIQGPSKAQLYCEEVEPGLIAIRYRVQEPGHYKVNVKFADQHVKGSPVSVMCPDATNGELRRVNEMEYQAAEPVVASVGEEASISLKLPKTTSPADVTARLLAPGGSELPVSISPGTDNAYALSFTPEVDGQHTLHVYNKGKPVIGSPFHFTVGALQKGDAKKVRATGQGVHSGEAGTPNAFTVYTREAGTGKLAVSVEGPVKAEMHFQDQQDGSCHVDYTVAEPGDYQVSVKFNEEHIRDSPFHVQIAPASSTKQANGHHLEEANSSSSGLTGEASRVQAHGPGLHKFTVGKHASFNVDTGSAGPNLLMVGVVTSKGPCEEVVVKHMGAGHFVVNYKIHEKVRGLIFVRYGDREVPGSPFPIESN
ncbi:unnamed protein product, partial [Mesorhabditis spiculigera]